MEPGDVARAIGDSQKERQVLPEPERSPAVLKKRLKKLAEALERAGVDVDELGTVRGIKSIRAGEHEGFYKDNDGNAHVVEMTHAEIILTPSWETGPEWPVVQPAKPTVVRAPKLRRDQQLAREIRASNGLRVAVILPDPQIGFRRDIETGALDPFQDEAAIACAMEVTAAVDPDRVIWLGDFLDLPMFGK